MIEVNTYLSEFPKWIKLNQCSWFCVEPVTLHCERPSAGSAALWLPPHPSFLSPRLTEQENHETQSWFHHAAKIDPAHLTRKQEPSVVPSAHIEHTPLPSSSLLIAFSSRCCAHCHAVVLATSLASDVLNIFILCPLLLGFMVWVTSSGRRLLAPTWGWTSPSPYVLYLLPLLPLSALTQPYIYVLFQQPMALNQVRCLTCCIWMVPGK